MSEIRPEINVSPATLTLRPGGVVIFGGPRDLIEPEAHKLQNYLTSLLPEARGVIVIARCVQPFAFVINVEPDHGN